MAKASAAPETPKPLAGPPPVDTDAAIRRALNRDATDRELRRSKGRTDAFSMRGGEAYRAPGSKSLLGG